MPKEKTPGGDLNPIEDLKGAVKFIKNLDPIEEVKEFMETAARVLEPSESDLRVVEPEEGGKAEATEPGEHGKRGRPIPEPRQSETQEMHLE